MARKLDRRPVTFHETFLGVIERRDMTLGVRVRVPLAENADHAVPRDAERVGQERAAATLRTPRDIVGAVSRPDERGDGQPEHADVPLWVAEEPGPGEPDPPRGDREQEAGEASATFRQRR